MKSKFLSIKANAGAMHEQSTIEFFSKLLDDKEQQLVYLRSQNDVLLVKSHSNIFENNFKLEQRKAISTRN